ncbi:hypothetical protein K8I31_04260 [bacterium]|nr:hypothetical protein [bacterium]
MMKIDGDIDAGVIDEIEHTVSLLRSQGSAGLIWNGESVGHVQAQELNRLTRTFRVYRQMGGRIVLAAFPEPALRAIERTTWKRFINVFKNVDEAKDFLGIQPNPIVVQAHESPEFEQHDMAQEADITENTDDSLGSAPDENEEDNMEGNNPND